MYFQGFLLTIWFKSELTPLNGSSYSPDEAVAN